MALGCNAIKNGNTPSVSKSPSFEAEVVEPFTEKPSFNKAFAKGKPSQPQPRILICIIIAILISGATKISNKPSIDAKDTSDKNKKNATPCCNTFARVALVIVKMHFAYLSFLNTVFPSLMDSNI
jgi:hypothetical protein